MTDFLEQVVAERRADVAAAKARVPEYELMARIQEADQSEKLIFRRQAMAGGIRVDLGGRLMPLAVRLGDALAIALNGRRREGRLGVIAEVKRRSPALGVLAEGADPGALAQRYETAGAAAISVLTEPRHWGGSLADLAAVRDRVYLPVLCKDVIVDEYQLVEARAAGADAVLLIAEALDDALLQRLMERAKTIGLGVLVEAHEPVAFGRAVRSGASVVGINARDLRKPTDIDIGRARQLHAFARPEQMLVAESGIESIDDARMLPARVDAVLIGTALMRADDPAPLIRGIASIRRTVHA
ncbi:MAG TPA: indole-3-glycerol phosphate synthase TrpC [Candidatus Limnocylindria bacterium]|jgi:indole-3-glycerol phosphate synthase|nr:indole-3-glycerol phosphate synthase TrpC [Candidatus Limnocylindria bacterium]